MVLQATETRTLDFWLDAKGIKSESFEREVKKVHFSYVKPYLYNFSSTFIRTRTEIYTHIHRFNDQIRKIDVRRANFFVI